MTRKADVHKCPHCGCIVSVLKGGEGHLKCCDKAMVEVTPDEAKKLSYGLARPGAP
jgi:desulfoferrodoxin-like iron-binding protein